MEADANNEPVNSITSAFVDIIVCPLGPIKLVEPDTVNDPVMNTLPETYSTELDTY
jgi:hypothetical protein